MSTRITKEDMCKVTLSKESLRKIFGPPRREITDNKEYTDLSLIFDLIGPIEVSNNQHSWTEVYRHNNKIYHVTSGFTDRPIMEEIFEDE